MAQPPDFGSQDLRLPDSLRQPLLDHLAQLRQRYRARGWAGRAGFGKKPALVVIDLARFWLDASQQIGSQLDSVVDAACRLLETARQQSIPVIFTSYLYDPAEPPSPHDRKMPLHLPPNPEALFDLDPRLGRRATEKLLRKRYASAFKGTHLHEMLTGLGIDTLIVAGVSTSHCIYATCRDATDSFRVIVPRQAVGERCELFHHVSLLDIDIDLADVMELDEVLSEMTR